MTRWTSTKLVDEAQRRGYDFTARQITEWVELGFLDKRKTVGTGRGSKPHAWTDPQAELFFVLCQQRHNNKIANATVANIPVAWWLYRGDEYVTILQLRRCLRTWANKYSTNKMAAINRTVRDHIAVLPDKKRADAYARDMCAEIMLEISAAQRDTITDVERGQLIDAVTRLGYAPDQASILGEVIAMRLLGTAPFYGETRDDEYTYTDDKLNDARRRYLATAASTLNLAKIGEEMNQTCMRFLTLLGRLEYNEAHGQ